MDISLLFSLWNARPLVSFLGDTISTLIYGADNGVSIATLLGNYVGGVGVIAGTALLVKQAITGDEGFKTIKQIALFSIWPAISLAVAQLINLTVVGESLTNFFIIIRHLLYMWDFFLDIPTLLDLLLLSLIMLGAYWTYKMGAFFTDFFNHR